MDRTKIQWLRSSPFLLVHLVALLGPFFVPFAWKWVGLCAALYVIRMFFVTAGYHRYFSHRTFKIHRVTQFFLAFFTETSMQKGVLWWAANHRHHHRYSDQPEDLHSPVQKGFWWSHMGWILAEVYEDTRWDLIPDFKKYPELIFLNRHHLLPVISLAVGLFVWGGPSALVWGFFVSSVLLFHGTATINSLSHVFGSRRYITTDTSRNNFWLALVTLGEGWHNNHHCYMGSARQGFFWWELDFTYYGLKMLSWVGLVKNIKEPPLEKLEQKRLTQSWSSSSLTQSIEDVTAPLLEPSTAVYRR